MDSHGFYHGLTCKRCGKPLHGQDSGYPAESYAGTYNGLCYPCTNAGPFVQSTEMDGATIMSYPPHSPSWRRDRETFIAYPDCEECHGKGRFMVSRNYGMGGPYPRSCEPCGKRYDTHPLRVWYHSRQRQRFDAANNAFMGRLRAAKLLVKQGKGKKGVELPLIGPIYREEIEAIRAEVWQRFISGRDSLNAYYDTQIRMSV